jgi:Flp pilus assembly protein TadG
MFAFSLLALIVAAGGAIDFARAMHARDRLQAAVDSAAIAAARVWQIENDVAAAEAKALAHYRAHKPDDVVNEAPAFTPDAANSNFTVAATAELPTPFLSLAGIETLRIAVSARANVRPGTPVEVSLMLDAAQGMAGPKLQALQAAASSFVDYVLRGQEGTDLVRIALAPYAEGVRPGDPYFDLVVGSPASTTRFDDVNGNHQTYRKTQCTAERVGSEAFTAAAPYDPDKLIAIYTKNGQCTPDAGNPVTPLTSNKAALIDAIGALRAGGLNGGHIGVGWTWYLLSPEWSGVWPLPSKPQPYGSVQKVAVLMTDGDWQVAYDASGVATRDSGRNPNNGASDAYSRQLCDNMKATGIIIYAVGFDLREAKAIANMRNCATDSGKFYNAADGAELQAVYHDIAVQIGQVRLTN